MKRFLLITMVVIIALIVGIIGVVTTCEVLFDYGIDVAPIIDAIIPIDDEEPEQCPEFHEFILSKGFTYKNYIGMERFLSIARETLSAWHIDMDNCEHENRISKYSQPEYSKYEKYVITYGFRENGITGPYSYIGDFYATNCDYLYVGYDGVCVYDFYYQDKIAYRLIYFENIPVATLKKFFEERVLMFDNFYETDVIASMPFSKGIIFLFDGDYPDIEYWVDQMKDLSSELTSMYR